MPRHISATDTPKKGDEISRDYNTRKKKTNYMTATNAINFLRSPGDLQNCIQFNLGRCEWLKKGKERSEVHKYSEILKEKLLKIQRPTLLFFFSFIVKSWRAKEEQFGSNFSPKRIRQLTCGKGALELNRLYSSGTWGALCNTFRPLLDFWAQEEAFCLR